MSVKVSRRLLTSVAFLCGLLLLTLLYTYSFEDFTITRTGGQPQPASLPFSDKSQKSNGLYTLSGYMETGPLSPKHFQIIPDDKLVRLKINGQAVDLSDIPKSKLQDWQEGFKIDLGGYLTQERNSVEFVFRDYAGLYGIKMFSDPSESRLLPFRLLWSLCLGVLIWNFLIGIGLRRDLALVVFVGVACRILYTILTGYNVRGHDTGEHIEYVMHFVDSWSLPSLDSAKDGAYFHPPAYYMIAAIFYKAADLFHPDQSRYAYGVLQYLSVAFSGGFLIFCALLIEKLFQVFRNAQLTSNMASSVHYRFAGMAALALIALWPSAIMHSARIGNDPLLYMAFVAGLYYIYSFFIEPSGKKFLLGALFTALAIATKANGVILAAVGGVALITLWWTRRPLITPQLLKKGAIPATMVVGALALAFYPGIALKMKGDRTHLYIDNIENVSSALRVGNKAENFLWMDLKIFITEPYTSPYKDELGRQYFANYLSKTGLVGEWSFSGDLAENSVTVASFAFVLMMLYLIVGLYHFRRGDYLLSSPVLWSYGLLVASVYYMRMTFPVNIDFRYILPVLLPFAALYNLGLIRIYENGKTRIALTGYGIELMFLLGSIAFFLHFFIGSEG